MLSIVPRRLRDRNRPGGRSWCGGRCLLLLRRVVGERVARWEWGRRGGGRRLTSEGREGVVRPKRRRLGDERLHLLLLLLHILLLKLWAIRLLAHFLNSSENAYVLLLACILVLLLLLLLSEEHVLIRLLLIGLWSEGLATSHDGGIHGRTPHLALELHHLLLASPLLLLELLLLLGVRVKALERHPSHHRLLNLERRVDIDEVVVSASSVGCLSKAANRKKNWARTDWRCSSKREAPF